MSSARASASELANSRTTVCPRCFHRFPEILQAVYFVTITSDFARRAPTAHGGCGCGRFRHRAFAPAPRFLEVRRRRSRCSSRCCHRYSNSRSGLRVNAPAGTPPTAVVHSGGGAGTGTARASAAWAGSSPAPVTVSAPCWQIRGEPQRWLLRRQLRDLPVRWISSCAAVGTNDSSRRKCRLRSRLRPRCRVPTRFLRAW